MICGKCYFSSESLWESALRTSKIYLFFFSYKKEKKGVGHTSLLNVMVMLTTLK